MKNKFDNIKDRKQLQRLKKIRLLKNSLVIIETVTRHEDTKNTNLKQKVMETNITVSQRYSKELEEIEEQVELLKTGECPDFQLINKIKSLIICAYYDGKCEGIQQMHEILKN